MATINFGGVEEKGSNKRRVSFRKKLDRYLVMKQ